MASKLFDGVIQWEFDWQGRKAKLPVFYYDNTSFSAIYTAATAEIKRLLPDPRMRPVELMPGRCLVAFTAFEYRKTDIDPYNEFSISFLISHGGLPLPGLTAAAQLLSNCFHAYVWQLPVTTEIARVGGVELYGFPKFIASIDFERTAERIVCTLTHEGKRILTLSGAKPPTSQGRRSRYVTYSVKDGSTLIANVVTDPLEFGQSRGPDAARLELGDHPIATELGRIGLSATPLLYQYAPRTETILFAGRNLLDR